MLLQFSTCSAGKRGRTRKQTLTLEDPSAFKGGSSAGFVGSGAVDTVALISVFGVPIHAVWAPFAGFRGVTPALAGAGVSASSLSITRDPYVMKAARYSEHSRPWLKRDPFSHYVSDSQR